MAARHLHLLGYRLSVFYPKKAKHPHIERLEHQLINLGIPFLSTPEQVRSQLAKTDRIIDAFFGFSFKPPVREPFGEVIELLKNLPTPAPTITSVDIPSGWSVDDGPNAADGETHFTPDVLVSLTCPKPASQYFKGRHFVGGRFVDQKFADKWGFEIPKYEGLDQVVEIDNPSKI